MRPVRTENNQYLFISLAFRHYEHGKRSMLFLESKGGIMRHTPPS